MRRVRLALGVALAALFLCALPASAHLANTDSIGGYPPIDSANLQASLTQIYRVAPGDTLDSLAQRYNENLKALVTQNNIADPNLISIGEFLTITPGLNLPGGVSFPAPPPPKPAPPVQHQASPVVVTSASTSSSGSWCYGLPDNYMVRYIINHESHCNVYAHNPSGACGIGQLMNQCDGFNGWAQAAAMVRYVNERYGGWSRAYSHEVSYGWY